MKRWFSTRHWPLQLRIVLLLFVSSVVPLLALGVVEYQHARGQALAGTEALLAARGDELEGKLDAFNRLYLRGSRRNALLPDSVRYCAADAPTRRRLASSMERLLQQWNVLDPAIRGASLVDASGVVIAASEKPLEGARLGQQDFVRKALAGADAISDLHVSDAAAGATPTIAYATPVRDERDRVIGASVLWVKAAAFWKVVAEGNEKAGEKSFGVIFDQYGVRIAHSYSPAIVFSPAGPLEPAVVDAMVAQRRFGERTREMLADVKAFPEQFQRARGPTVDRAIFRGYAPVNDQWNEGVARRLDTVPWTLFYMIPEKSLDAPLQDLARRVAWATGAVLLLAVIAGLWVARGITGSLRLVAGAAESLDSCSAELAASVKQTASGISETATAVSQATSTVEEVKQTARLATDKARFVAESAQRTAQFSAGGRESVDGSVEAMRRIQEQMNSIVGSVVRLSEQGQAIGDIIATVNDLSEQSNLLAVNAAIEAAKAGDQGKGFAVVAQEVRNLAAQSKHATAQVRAILSDIQKATGAAVLAAEQGGKAVEAGAKLSGEVGTSIGVLAQSITESSGAATQIAASAQQQSVGLDQLAQAMQSIREASVQNVASTQQTEAAARNLRELGGQLRELVERYGV